MFDLRDMELLAALATHRHFARAAGACGISQPAFSARIQNLERALGAAIVKRGNRFLGFTEEGEIALKWAHRLLADADGLHAEIGSAKDTLSGQLVIAAVPTAIAVAAEIPGLLAPAHPSLQIQIRTAPNSLIARGLEDGSVDAAITYLDTSLPTQIDQIPLYDEGYDLLAPRHMLPEDPQSITWREAASLPLCLLTRDMRNRRIIDDAFDTVGCKVRPIIETNTFTAALAQVSAGRAATIAPRRLASFLLTAAGDAVAPSLVEPVVAKPIGLITRRRDPLLPAVAALIKALKTPPGLT